MTDAVTVEVSNSYACGRESGGLVDVPAPAGTSPAELEVWWEETVYAATGDGHPCGAGEDALYEVEVITAGEPFADLVGQIREWG